MRCFVTGVAGFVGSHLAERLLADGHEVCGIDSFANDYDRSFKEQNLEGLRSWSMFRFIEGDLMEVVLQPMLEGVDWVFHQAGQEKGRDNWATAFTNYTQSNVLITLRLLEAALRFGWIQRFVYASSSSVYGKAARLPIQEDALERPHSAHGVTKLAAESLCSLYYRRFGLPTVSLRYFSVYGPRQRPDMAFHRFCKAIVCHEPLYLYGDGYQTRDFTYIDDVVEANIRAAVASEAAGQVINIGGGTNVTLRSIVRMLEEISGSRIKVVIDDIQQDDVRHICADTQRAQQLLAYRPCVELRDGLVHEFEFIRRLYDRWPNSAARGAIHQGSSDDGPMSSKDSTVTRKATLVNLTDVLKPQTSQVNNHLTEPIDNTAQRMELQTSALANARQEPQAPQFQFHVNVPSDKEDEHAKLISSAKMATPVGLAAVPTVQMSQADSHVAESMADVEQGTEAADDYAAASKATAANLTAVLEPEIKQADSQTVPQTPQVSQADSHVAESMADVEQRTEAANDYAAVSEATPPNLTAVLLEPKTRQADSQTVSQTPHISQADSHVAESIADVEQQIELQVNVWQRSQAPQFYVNVPSDKQSEHVKPTAPPRLVGAPQAPTGPWVPPNRLARPAPSHAEQNHMRVAIIALLLVGLLILGGCLAVYTQLIGNPSAVTGQAGAVSSAAITITTDASKTLENTFSLTAVTGEPDTVQHQIKARQVSVTTQPVSKSVQVMSESTYANTSTGDAASQPTSDDQNTTTSPVVQQSDIDAAANELEIANTPSAASVLQPQLAQNEQLVGNPQCQPQVSADHKAGDVADSVRVTVVFSCSGVAYDQGAAEKMAAQELSEQAKKDIGNLYTLSGQITTTVKNASVSDASQGTITITIEARGTWILQTQMDQQRAWANSLVGKTKEAAQSFLLRQKGVKQANILLQGGDGRTLPTDARKITIKVQPVAGS